MKQIDRISFFLSVFLAMSLASLISIATLSRSIDSLKEEIVTIKSHIQLLESEIYKEIK